MKSMTGYGVARGETEQSHIEVSVKTVNGRFLECRYHIARELSFLEQDLKKIISQFIQRGTVDIFVYRKMGTHSLPQKVVLHKELAHEWIKAYKDLAKSLKIKPNMDLFQLARLPEILGFEDDDQLIQSDAKEILKLTEKASKLCLKEREREGLALQKDIRLLLNELQKNIQNIEKLREEANSVLQQRYEQKIKARLGDLAIDPARITQEIVIQLERADISEEITRLNEHINTFNNMIENQNVEGKKLDFYTQELLREVNTIGSKSQISALTQAVVNGKTIIEKLREQVQNIE